MPELMNRPASRAGELLRISPIDRISRSGCRLGQDRLYGTRPPGRFSTMTETTGGWDPARATRQTRCERCGTTFGCRNLGEEGSCWCSLEAFRLPEIGRA